MGSLRSAEPEQTPPHVLFFPYPCPSHIHAELKLAELLCLSGLHVTFLVTPVNQHRLLHHTDIYSYFETEYPEIFRFETLAVGGPDEDPIGRGVEDFKEVAEPLFREYLVGKNKPSPSQIPISCIVADGVTSFVIDIAVDFGIQVFSYRASSIANVWFYFSASKFLESGEIPFKGDDLDAPFVHVPESDTFLRRRDLPIFLRDKSAERNLKLMRNETLQTRRTEGLIVDTLEELEGPVIAQVRSQCQVYAIGPLHTHLKARLKKPMSSSNRLWKDDASCISWLNEQPSRSVIYISFGSIIQLTMDQLMELWHGLINSGKRFLLVIRPGSITCKDGGKQIATELMETTTERGYIVSWAPQEKVLTHHAVGAFLSHNGWNSTLESITAAVPMIGWPSFDDQHIHSRFVGEVWKLGLDMKDTNDRVIIENMVRELMDNRREEFMRTASVMAEKAKKAVIEGGSSYHNLDLLVEAIRSKSVKTSNGNGVH